MYIYICMYECMYVCMYECMYVYIYIKWLALTSQDIHVMMVLNASVPRHQTKQHRCQHLVTGALKKPIQASSFAVLFEDDMQRFNAESW